MPLPGCCCPSLCQLWDPLSPSLFSRTKKRQAIQLSKDHWLPLKSRLNFQFKDVMFKNLIRYVVDKIFTCKSVVCIYSIRKTGRKIKDWKFDSFQKLVAEGFFGGRCPLRYTPQPRFIEESKVHRVVN